MRQLHQAAIETTTSDWDKVMKTVIIGLDAFDPDIFERLENEARLPNLGRFVQKQSYSRFSVSNPPQSEVSWTSIATGLSPGEHGMFDFVHRDPSRYSVFASLLPTKKVIGGVQFASPFTARTLFDSAVEQGYPAKTLWWPATFPARPQAAVASVPGLGTPDILGRLGVGAFYSSAAAANRHSGKISTFKLVRQRNGLLSSSLLGPAGKKGQAAELQLELEIVGDSTATLRIGDKLVRLQKGVWSPILELSFKMGRFFKLKAITRVILTELEDEVSLYILPLQIHPLKPPWPYGTPGSFIKDTWYQTGPYLTLGWPQDTTALEEGFISDDAFLALCKSIFEQRKRAFLHHLSQFHEGVLAVVFDTLDRVQHMYLRDRPDVVDAWYEQYDQLVGDALETIRSLQDAAQIRLIVLSDHGFGQFEHKVHLNRWLIDRGYLVHTGSEASSSLHSVDWNQTAAYAVGLNSVYLNLEGRESSGTVPSGDRDNLIDRLRMELLTWHGSDGLPIIEVALPGADAFAGPLLDYAPDLFVGYRRGYRASQSTGLGGWAEEVLERNTDHWGADHCMHADTVPGVIFASHEMLKDVSQPTYRDIPYMATGVHLDSGRGGPPPTIANDEDEQAVEARLKGLGYL